MQQQSAQENSGYITRGQGVFRVYRNSNYKFYLTVTLSLLVFTCRGKNFDYLFFFTYVFSLFCCFIQLFFFSDQVEWEEKNAKKIWFEEEGLQQSFCGVMTFKETMARISKMADKMVSQPSLSGLTSRINQWIFSYFYRLLCVLSLSKNFCSVFYEISHISHLLGNIYGVQIIGKCICKSKIEIRFLLTSPDKPDPRFSLSRVWINDLWFMIHESNLKFHKWMFFKKLKNHES